MDLFFKFWDHLCQLHTTIGTVTIIRAFIFVGLLQKTFQFSIFNKLVNE
jgi:hypothetical protein